MFVMLIEVSRQCMCIAMCWNMFWLVIRGLRYFELFKWLAKAMTQYMQVVVVCGIHRTGHVSAYMLDVLHWQPLQQRIMFRIGAMVWRCILGLAPAYLRDLCCPPPGTRGRSSLRFVPFARTSTTQARAFSLVGPSVWNGLLWRNDCSQGFFLTHFTLASKLFFLAVQGSGALLSSNVEEVLYKSP